MIQASCPQCKRTYQFCDEQVGLAAKCRCGGRFVVPAAPATECVSKNTPETRIGVDNKRAFFLWSSMALLAIGVAVSSLWIFFRVARPKESEKVEANLAESNASPVEPDQTESLPWWKATEETCIEDAAHVFNPSVGSSWVPLLSKDELRVTLFDMQTKTINKVDCSELGQLFDVQISHQGDVLALVPQNTETPEQSNKGQYPADVHLWSVEKQKQIAVLPLGQKYLWTAFLDEKRLLAIGSFEASVWDITNQQQIARWRHARPISSKKLTERVAVSPDGRFIAEIWGSEKQTVIVRDTHDNGRVWTSIDETNCDLDRALAQHGLKQQLAFPAMEKSWPYSPRIPVARRRFG